MVRTPLSVAFLALLAVLPSGLVTTSCGEVCTLAGCGDELTLTFDETVPRDYTVDVELGGQRGIGDCTAATAEGDTTSDLSIFLDDDGRRGFTCGPDGIVFFLAPTDPTIVITFSDGTTTTVEVKPAFEETYPNGEDCDPTCRTATYEIDIHAPGG